MALALFSIALLCLLASLVIGLVAVVTPSKVPWIRSRRHGAFVYFVVAVPISFVVMAAASIYVGKFQEPPQALSAKPKSEPSPETLPNQATAPAKTVPLPKTDGAKLRNAIGRALDVVSVQVVSTGKRRSFVVRHKIGFVWSEADVVTMNALAIGTVSRAALDLFPELSAVTVEAETHVTDKYGRESVDKTLGFTIQGDDLRKINWENMYSAKILDLVDVRPSFVGKRSIVKYCDDLKLGDDGAAFCLRAIVGSSK